MSFTTEHELSPELRQLEQQLESLVPTAMSPALLEHMEQSMDEVGAVGVVGEVTSTSGELDNVEILLSQMTPVSMSEEMLKRMEASMDDVASEILPAADELDDLGIHLEQMAPASMPEDMLGRMVRAMDRWHEHVPVEEKVVPFDENADAQNINQRSGRKTYGGGMIAAAAAVAMLGAVAALVLPRVINTAEPNNSVVVVGEDSLGGSQPVGSVVDQPHDAWLVPDSLSHNVTNTHDQGVIMSRDNTPHRCIRIDYINKLKVQDDEGREIEIERPGSNYMLLPVEIH